MRHEKPTGSMVRVAQLGSMLGFAGLVVAACNGGGSQTSRGPLEDIGEAKSAQFTNGGFETGTAGMVPPAPWALTDWLNPDPNGVTLQNPQTYAGLNLVAQGMACTSNANCVINGGSQYGTCTGGFCSPTTKTLILNGSNQPDPTLGATQSLRWPRYGNQCALINQLGNASNVNQLSQTMTVGAADVDPTDNKIHARLVVAPVLEDPGHSSNQQPYFFVQVVNLTQANAVLYSNFNFSNQSGVPWKTYTTGTGANQKVYKYTDWQLIDVSNGMNMGDMVRLDLVAAGCSIGGHFGELYVDGLGTTIPGLFVSGTGPAQANTGSNITYTINYKNGSAPVACATAATCTLGEACTGGFCAETGVVIDFTTPPGTTIQSFTSPPGATCANVAGTITCTFTGPVPPGAAGSFTVTVSVNALTACTTSANCATGINCVNGFCDTSPIVCGNYGIQSGQEPHLLGNKIITSSGCFADSDCTGGQWCFESTGTCTDKYPNNTPIPTDPPHMTPALNGTCNDMVSKLVCASGKCDLKDNKCGYLNNDGPCTAGATGNGSVVCRSGVCDPDGRCGYADGDGPCTAANAGTICRSGVCAPTSMLCGQCAIDGDCSAGNWCKIGKDPAPPANACTPKLANGQPVPTNPGHNPTLNGMCTPGAGAAVCQSGVCDPKDNLCGYADQDGPCTGNAQCRSGVCSSNGLCAPVGGCNVDADCAAGNWCNESAHMCTPKLANGIAVPTDPPHMNPTLNGMCTTGVGAVVCQSGVCDPKDNLCGYANEDGPCTGNAQCRSGACSSNGLCEPSGGCNVDADCMAGNWCKEASNMCTPTIANGQPVPTDPPHMNPTLNGMCGMGVGAVVCTSGVCDPKDNECGYANGDGPCTTAGGPTVCRSGVCGKSGVCVPVGGCSADSDCPAGQWCQESTGACMPKLTNGTPVPSDPPHMNPTLNGMCGTGVGPVVCASGVCDMKDNECGYANGDGPCTSANGDSVCRSGMCGTNGVCVQCTMDSQCPASTPHCNMAGICVACTDSSQCSGTTPICDTGSATCVPCTGDSGSTTKDPCPAGSPFCFLSGPMAGACGKCMTNADCTGHMGNVCNTTTGLCVSGCLSDSDCQSTQWCDAVAPATGMCQAKLPNGTALPTTPSSVATCTGSVGMRVCQSGVCDPKDNTCGLATGDGTCNNDNQCRNDNCNAASGICTPPGCTSDSQCPSGDFCKTTSTGGTGGGSTTSEGTCTPKLPDGQTCTTNSQCQNGDCENHVCSSIIGSGNGLVCAARDSSGESSSNAGLVGLMLAVAAGLSRRSRRGARREAR